MRRTRQCGAAALVSPPRIFVFGRIAVEGPVQDGDHTANGAGYASKHLKTIAGWRTLTKAVRLSKAAERNLGEKWRKGRKRKI
jgi:hypothetical protein